MSRVRLTARGRSAADQTPYPGNVNQPDRKDPAIDDYHTFEQRVNHELPDMRHDWQGDDRDDIGFGIPEAWGKSPTVASVRVAANKAVRVAVLLLGDKVSDDVIEAQARDLMSMGPQAMDRTLQRFSDTQALYAADEEKKDEEKKDDKAEAKCSADESEKKDEEKKDDKAEEKKAADDKKVPDFIKEKMEEKKDDKKAADESDKKDEEKKEDKAEAKCSADESDKKDDEDKKEVSAKKTGSTEFDIELSASVDDEVEPDPEADERLASLFDDPTVAAAGNSGRKAEASQKKTGITKLGGQPRVASAEGAGVDISSIWQSAPDVSEAFK